jgi:hypothetical protein
MLETNAVFARHAGNPAAKRHLLGPDHRLLHPSNVGEIGPPPIPIDMQGQITVALAGPD